MMDLSHWDLIEEFSLYEAACLAAGFDPNLDEITPEQKAKANLIRRVMNDAHASTIRYAKIFYHSMNSDSHNLHRSRGGDELESVGLSDLYFLYPDSIPKKPLENYLDEEPTFTRYELGRWFRQKEFASVYLFSEAPNETDMVEEEKPLTSKERTTLLTLIALLAEEAKIDISKPSKAASLILIWAEKKSIQIGQRTIEECLKKIPDALEKRSRADA